MASAHHQYSLRLARPSNRAYFCRQRRTAAGNEIRNAVDPAVARRPDTAVRDGNWSPGTAGPHRKGPAPARSTDNSAGRRTDRRRAWGDAVRMERHLADRTGRPTVLHPDLQPRGPDRTAGPTAILAARTVAPSHRAHRHHRHHRRNRTDAAGDLRAEKSPVAAIHSPEELCRLSRQTSTPIRRIVPVPARSRRTSAHPRTPRPLRHRRRRCPSLPAGSAPAEHGKLFRSPGRR